jgi:hypothetical protein
LDLNLTATQSSTYIGAGMITKISTEIEGNKIKKREKRTVLKGNEALVGDLELERIEEGGGVVEHSDVGDVDGAHRI